MPEVEKATKKDIPEEKAEKLKEKAQKAEEKKIEKGKPEGKLDEEQEKESEDQPQKGGFKLKLPIPPIVKTIVIFVVAFLVLIAGAFFLASKALKPFMKAQIQKSATLKTKAVAKKKVETTEVKEVFLVSDMIINPAETNGTRFLNTTIGLGVGDVLAKTALEERSAQVRDALISILTTKTIPELVHPDGKKILRKEIIERINRIIAPQHIMEVYFVDFVLQ
jgi:flagellar basal body-associated protein FliL